MDTTQLVLLLSETPGIGEKTIAAILRRNAVLRRDGEELLRLAPARFVEEYGIGREKALTIQAAGRARRTEIETTARALRRSGVSVLTLLDATYPWRLLERLDDPPPVLYAYGNLERISSPIFAVANSNGSPEEALAACDAAAACAIEAGWSPVTGHNRPAYQRPALVARRNGGRIVYVLDRGLLEAFGDDLSRELFAAARIWSPAYDPQCDLTLSPFPLRAHSLAAHNRRRDTLIFALASAVFVGHVRPGGQMEGLCLQALERGTPVFRVWTGESDRLQEAGARRIDPVEAGMRLAGIDSQ